MVPVIKLYFYSFKCCGHNVLWPYKGHSVVLSCGGAAVPAIADNNTTSGLLHMITITQHSIYNVTFVRSQHIVTSDHTIWKNRKTVWPLVQLIVTRGYKCAVCQYLLPLVLWPVHTNIWVVTQVAWSLWQVYTVYWGQRRQHLRGHIGYLCLMWLYSSLWPVGTTNWEVTKTGVLIVAVIYASGVW